MVIFKSKQKKLEGDFKIKLCGARLCAIESVKYLGVKIDINLSWQNHVDDNGRVAQWLVTCARKPKAPGSNPAAGYVQS